MIGFNTFSSPSGLACFAASAQNQVEGMSTEWQSSPNRSDTTSSAAGNLEVVGLPVIVFASFRCGRNPNDHPPSIRPLEVEASKTSREAGGARHAESDRKAIS